MSRRSTGMDTGSLAARMELRVSAIVCSSLRALMGSNDESKRHAISLEGTQSTTFLQRPVWLEQEHRASAETERPAQSVTRTEKGAVWSG